MSSEPGLVPELAVTDYEASKRFWCDLIGFSLRYERPEEGFGYLVLGSAHLMLDQVASLDAAWERLTQAQWPIFVEPEEKWYRAGDVEIGVRQFLIQDPDGYLVRLQEEIGERLLSKAHPDRSRDVRSSD